MQIEHIDDELAGRDAPLNTEVLIWAPDIREGVWIRGVRGYVPGYRHLRWKVAGWEKRSFSVVHQDFEPMFFRWIN